MNPAELGKQITALLADGVRHVRTDYGLNGMYVLGGFWAVILIVMLVMLLRHQSVAEIADKPTTLPVNRRGSRPRRAVLPLTLGNVTVDLQPGLTDILHVAIGGTSRLGKSTAIVDLYDQKIGILTIALDDSVPITNKVRSLPDGIEWWSDPSSPVALDLMNGDPRTLSEVLVGGFGTVGTGKWQRIARARLWTELEKIDESGRPRTFEQAASGLMLGVPGNPEATRACRDWADRLAIMSRTLGPALGPGLDLVDAMRHQKKVLLRMNRFLSPQDAPMLGGMLLVHARMVAASAGVPFVLVVEEAGQMAQYQPEIAPLTQAAGARGVSTVLITQNLSLLPITVSNNVSIWVSFAQEDAGEQRFAAHKMELLPDQLRRNAFPGKREAQGRGWCYVRGPGVNTTLVHIKPNLKQSAVAPGAVKIPTQIPTPYVLDADDIEPIYDDDIEAPEWAPEPIPDWIGHDVDRLRAWNHCKRADEASLLWHPDKGFWDGSPCLEWQKTAPNGRGRIRINGQTLTVYVQTFKWAGGIIPPSYTIDHLCANTLCCWPEHLEAVTIDENNARRAGRAAALKLLAA